jgi:hypothetical protein
MRGVFARFEADTRQKSAVHPGSETAADLARRAE